MRVCNYYSYILLDKNAHPHMPSALQLLSGRVRMKVGMDPNVSKYGGKF